MPIVPTYERTENINAGPTGPMASPDAFGAAIGRGLQQAGAGIQALGSDLQQRQEKLDAFDAQTKAQAFNNANDMALVEAGKTVQPGGAGLTDGVMKGFEKSSSAFLKNLPESQRARMAPFIEVERGRLQTNAFKAETGLQEDYQRGHVNRYQNQVLTDVYRDPSQVDAATARFETYVDSTTLSPAEQAQLKEAGRQQIRGFALRRSVGDEATAAADAAMAGGATAAASPAAGAAAARDGAPSGVAQFVDRIIGVESGGNPNAKNPKSTATGLGQFIESTWLGMLQKHRPDLAGSLSRGEQLALRKDPTLSREMTRLYAEENAGALQRAGHAPTAGNVYLTHFLGPGGALAVLGAGAGASVASVLPAGVIAANRSILAGKTVGDVVAWAARKMGGPAPAAQAAKQWSAADDPRFAGADIKDIMAADAAYAKAYGDRVKQYDDAKKALTDEVNETMRLGMELGQIPDTSDILSSGLGDKEMADRLVQRREAINRANTALTDEQGAINDEVAYADALGQPITREAITGLVDRNALSKADGAKWLNELTKREAEQGTIKQTEQRIADGAMFDPLDTDDRKGVDAYWSQGDALAKLQAGDGAEAMRLANVVDKTGIIPKAASGVIAGLLRSDDPAKLSTAVGIVDQLFATNAVAAARAVGQGGLNEADRMTYEAVRSLSPYLTPEQLVEKVKQLRDPGDRARREAVEKTAREELKAIDDAAVLDAFDESMWSDPEAPAEVIPGMREDFDALYTHFRRAFDDPTGAKDAATRVLKTQWGVSTIAGGQKLMKRPPEQVLPPVDGTHMWVERQLRAAIKGLGLEGPPPAPVAGSDATLDSRLRAMGQEEVSLDDVHLVTTRDTLADIAAGRSPRYRLVVKGPNGEWLSPGAVQFDPKAAADASLEVLQQRRGDFTAERGQRREDAADLQQLNEDAGFPARDDLMGQ